MLEKYKHQFIGNADFGTNGTRLEQNLEQKKRLKSATFKKGKKNGTFGTKYSIVLIINLFGCSKSCSNLVPFVPIFRVLFSSLKFCSNFS